MYDCKVQLQLLVICKLHQLFEKVDLLRERSQPSPVTPGSSGLVMMMYEVMPFVKEMLAQKPNRKMLRLYLIGSVLAVLGTVLALMEFFYQSLFYSGEPLDTELALLIAREQRVLEAEERDTRR
ncbi:hypothetical protein DPEC_G00194750 [Dallia pectoralis]|uniref:Uncharacterized protein n=1 Tax=Dallia pectoralis TaxID=75939 RepID=A0ACC2G744_DALPE|nr:hypothetical protein DPEC_G00194750 [Dallia pectoralis]